jgi:hypothetical protein
MLGKIVNIDCTEAIGDVHFSHSYVRGNWYSEKDSTPMLLAKSCHDLDIIQWLMDKPCKKVTSFGHLTYFRPENAPKGAPVRCADGTCPIADTCPYNCHRIYIENPEGFWGKSIFRNCFRRDALRSMGMRPSSTPRQAWRKSSSRAFLSVSEAIFGTCSVPSSPGAGKDVGRAVLSLSGIPPD